jgi:tryptophan synthase beta subunit
MAVSVDGLYKEIVPHGTGSAHAIVPAKRSHDDAVVVCFSGRGDKDCFEVARLMGEEIAE